MKRKPPINPRVGERYTSRYQAARQGVRTIEIVRIDWRAREIEGRLVAHQRVAATGGACPCLNCQRKRAAAASGRTCPQCGKVHGSDRIVRLSFRYLSVRWKKEESHAA